MNRALLACASLLVLAAPLRSAAATRQAEAYFEVRTRAQLAETFTLTDLQTRPDLFAGRLVELRGTVLGVATTDTGTTLLVGAAGEGAPSYTIALPAGKDPSAWPFLTIGAGIRALCRVAPGENGTGTLELRLPVKEDEAAALERDRARSAAEEARKAAAVRRSTTPRTLGSRGLGGGTVARAAQPAYSDSQLVDIYSRAVRYFNGRLAPTTARHIASTIIQYSRRYDLDARLVMAVIACESNFNPYAVSPVGAQGLGQLMPGTAAGLGVSNSFDTRANLEGSTRLLKNHILNMKRGGRPDLDAVKLALACYNAGAGAVRKYKGIPPYKETQQYVKKITRLYWQMLQPEERTWNPD